MQIKFKNTSSKTLSHHECGLDDATKYEWHSDADKHIRLVATAGTRVTFDVADVGSAVQGFCNAVIEDKCAMYLEWIFGAEARGFSKKDVPEIFKKLKLYKVPYEKISWRVLWDFGLRAVGFHFHDEADRQILAAYASGRMNVGNMSPLAMRTAVNAVKKERERLEKNARIKGGDVLRAIEKHLTKLVKEDIVVKVTEKDLCEMTHAHEHATLKDKDPAIQSALTDAANLAHSNHARACGGKWSYVSARWQQSPTPGEVLRLQFERYDGKIVELTAEEMHFHWRSCRGSHPLRTLVGAWTEYCHSA